MLVRLSNVLEAAGVLLVVVAVAAWDLRALGVLVGCVMVLVGYLIDAAQPEKDGPL